MFPPGERGFALIIAQQDFLFGKEKQFPSVRKLGHNWRKKKKNAWPPKSKPKCLTNNRFSHPKSGKNDKPEDDERKGEGKTSSWQFFVKAQTKKETKTFIHRHWLTVSVDVDFSSLSISFSLSLSLFIRWCCVKVIEVIYLCQYIFQSR